MGVSFLITAAEQARVQLQIDVDSAILLFPSPGDCASPPFSASPPLESVPIPRKRLSPRRAQALIVLGDVNSRMKDYYDFWAMSRTLPFEGADLIAAIGASFCRAAYPSTPSSTGRTH